MKIRLDFVTNSSSSSFIALCQKCTLTEYLSGAVPSDLTVATFGTYINEGIDMIELNYDLAQYIIDNQDEFRHHHYMPILNECYILLDSSYDEDIVLSSENMTKASTKFGQLLVISRQVDQHSSQTREDIKNIYIDSEW